MNAAHTPGPWRARAWQCHAATSVGREIDGRFEQIAECSGNGRQVRTEQEEADARLVAAAPELLEALKAFMALDRSFSTICDAHLEEEAAKSPMGRAVKLARSAIAKATGRAS